MKRWIELRLLKIRIFVSRCNYVRGCMRLDKRLGLARRSPLAIWREHFNSTPQERYQKWLDGGGCPY